MFTAQKLRKENIAEYLLYMWQIEDLIRANGLEIENIKKNIVDRYPLDEASRGELLKWFEELVVSKESAKTDICKSTTTS